MYNPNKNKQMKEDKNKSLQFKEVIVPSITMLKVQSGERVAAVFSVLKEP